jgi:hypothetical protein
MGRGGRGEDMKKGEREKEKVGRRGEEFAESGQLDRDGRRKSGGRGRRQKKNTSRRIGMGWHNGERASGRLQRSDGVGRWGSQG